MRNIGNLILDAIATELYTRSMLTVKQFAEKLKVSTRTVQRMIKNGQLQAEKKESKRFYWLINETELERLKKEE